MNEVNKLGYEFVLKTHISIKIYIILIIQNIGLVEYLITSI